MAEITNVVISSTQPYGEFTAGKYIRLEGEAHGVLSPREPIPDLDRALGVTLCVGRDQAFFCGGT
jgi:hypothetical protein